MTAITASSTSNRLTIDYTLDGCQHDFSVRLGCEPHDYRHLWGWACSKCWQQVFYSDLDACCEEEAKEEKK